MSNRTVKTNAFKLLYYAIGCLMISGRAVTAQTRIIEQQNPTYLGTIRNTADLALQSPPGNNARTYYYRVTKLFYEQAQEITRKEAGIQKGTSNAGFMQTMEQLVAKLTKDLHQPQEQAIPVIDFFQSNTNAALRNFRRYQMPSALDPEHQYLWVMIQVFENLNQINVGYLQSALSPEEKKEVWQRLMVQQQIISQLKSK